MSVRCFQCKEIPTLHTVEIFSHERLELPVGSNHRSILLNFPSFIMMRSISKRSYRERDVCIDSHSTWPGSLARLRGFNLGIRLRAAELLLGRGRHAGRQHARPGDRHAGRGTRRMVRCLCLADGGDQIARRGDRAEARAPVVSLSSLPAEPDRRLVGRWFHDPL